MPYAHVDFDIEQLDLLIQRDEEAWNTLYELLNAVLVSVARSYLIDHNLSYSMAEDMVQKTWVTAYAKIDDVDFSSRDFIGWVRLILKNHIRNENRRRFNQHFSLDVDEAFAAGSPEDGEIRPVEQNLEQQQQRQLFYSAFQQVLRNHFPDPEEQDIITARLLYREDLDGLAVRYNLTKRKISQLCYRAKEKVMQYIKMDLFFFQAAQARQQQMKLDEVKRRETQAKGQNNE